VRLTQEVVFARIPRNFENGQFQSHASKRPSAAQVDALMKQAGYIKHSKRPWGL
jgi:hypothetical protein